MNNANEEIDAIGQVDLQQTAIVDSKFKEALKGVNEGYKDSLSTIRLTSYEPNQLVYETSSPPRRYSGFLRNILSGVDGNH